MRPGRTTWKSVAVVAAIVVAWLLLPEIAGYGWRLFRGNAVEHAGWRIRVPGGWFAVNRGAALTVTRLPRFPWQASDVATLVPGRQRAVPRPIWQSAWEMTREQKTRQMDAEGFRPAGERSVPLGEGEVRCADYHGGASGQRRVTVCDAFGYDLVATFQGGATGHDRFYAILAALTPPATAGER